MNLSMSNHVSGILKSHTATQTKITGSRVDGIWVEGTPVEVPNIDVNVQPASDRELATLAFGGRRLVDVRRVYINTPVNISLSESDIWEFDCELTGQRFETIKTDVRPNRSYFKIFVSKLDE